MQRRNVLAALASAPGWPSTLNAQTASMAGSNAASTAAPAPLSTAAPARHTAITRRPLRFPADFGAHPEHRTEWWYLTGWLEEAETRRPFGFQVTFFRSATGLPTAGSRFSAQQLVSAHAALTDLQAGRQRHDQRIARSGFGVEALAADTDVNLRDWNLKRSGSPDQSHYRTQAQSDSARFAFDFLLDASQPILLQGEAGYSRKGPDPAQASHYYSHPQLALRGTLTLDGKPLTVTGRGWMDHEWSDALLASDAVGWDWTGMNLDDGSALTAFQLRRRDGTALYAGGSFRTRNGEVRNFDPNEVHFVAGRRWKSPSSGASYPVEWQVETPAGRFVIAALLDSQEQDSRASTGAFYWEGLSELRRPAGDIAGLAPRLGRGYLEMTGYAQRLAL